MHKLAFGLASRGWGGGGGGTISAEGGQYPLADYVRGDKICGGTKSAGGPNLLRHRITASTPPLQVTA